MALRSVEEIEVILDTFLCTLYSTASAVTGDTGSTDSECTFLPLLFRLQQYPVTWDWKFKMLT